MAYLIKPDNELLVRSGLERYHGIPFFLSKDGRYLDEVSMFLREKVVGDWTPASPNPSELAERQRLSENTAISYGEDLKNFTTYCERRRLDVKALSYQNLVDTYDRDMGSGKWSGRGKPLAAETINRRMRVACEYILWLADRDKRSAFRVPTKTIGTAYGSSSTRRQREAITRVGQRRVDTKRLRLPSRDAIAAFNREVYVRHGRARGTAVGFIFASGCRLEEVVLVRADQIPDPDTVDLDKHGRIGIIYGTKGGRVVGDTSKAGKPRHVRIRRDDLVKLHNYKELGRKKALRSFRKLNPGRPDPVQLFLDEETGSPLSRQALYRAWRRTKNRPVEGMGPHAGRHCFACYLVLDILEDEARLLKLTLPQYPQSMLRSRVEDIISTHVRPALGHVSEETTERYLDWLIDEIWVSSARLAHSNSLDAVR